jgi:hypothetical protein
MIEVREAKCVSNHYQHHEEQKIGAFAIAPLMLGFCALPANAEVPLDIAKTGHATVPVEGPFGEQQFVLDSGGDGSAIFEDIAVLFDFPDVERTKLEGQTGASIVTLADTGKVSLDGVRKGPMEAAIQPPRSDMIRLAGIVRLDVFGDRMTTPVAATAIGQGDAVTRG